MQDKVTAIVLNYNSSDDCEKCLNYLKKQDYENFSIIIVDNNSPKEGEVERLKNICSKREKLILHEKNEGFSKGNNIGLRAAVAEMAEWMLIINPDVEIRNARYISYVMEQLSNWPDAAVVGTNIYLPNGEMQNPMREVKLWEEILWPLEMISQKLEIWKGYRTADVTGYCEKISGCCFFISKKFLIKNNFLDDKVFMYCEEPILAKSVVKYGYKELYIKEVTAYHEHHAKKNEGNSKAKMQLFITSRLYYIREYSSYGTFGKSLAILARLFQKLIWKEKRKGD